MNPQNMLASLLQPKSPFSEAFKALRTNIQFANVDEPIKTILITSAGPEEGKTTVISNIAVTFSQSDYKVLLIDADLRRPKINKVFGVSGNKGLTNILVKQLNPNDCILKVGDIDIITSGPIPPNPSEMLGSNSFRLLLENLKTKYDIIFIDSPPVISVTDATILSKLVDGTIFVVSSCKTEIDMARKALELLENVGANILGVALNKSNNKNYGYYYQYTINEDSSFKIKLKELLRKFKNLRWNKLINKK